MMTKVEEILKHCVEICRQECGCRLRILFGLGEQVRQIGYMRRQGIKGDGTKKAIKLVRDHVLSKAQEYGYSVRTDDGYWYWAIRAIEVWSAEERQVLISANIPLQEIAPLQSLRDHGVGLISELRSGKRDGLHLRKEHRGTRPHIGQRNGENILEIKIRLTGGETNEQLEDIAKSFASGIIRLGRDPAPIFAGALEKTKYLMTNSSADR